MVVPHAEVSDETFFAKTKFESNLPVEIIPEIVPTIIGNQGDSILKAEITAAPPQSR